jgi:hypothetical protein
MRKYEITDERNPYNPRMRRIRALRPGPWGPIGTLGGWLESEENLDHDGECWVGGAAVVCGAARATHAALVCEWAWVCDGALVCDESRVSGWSRVGGESEVGGSARVNGWAQVCGSARVGGSADIDRHMVIVQGEQHKTPLYLDGSCDSLTHQGGGVVAVGCEVRPIAEWLERYQEIGQEHNYEPAEIEEYGELLEEMARMIQEER